MEQIQQLMRWQDTKDDMPNDAISNSLKKCICNIRQRKLQNKKTELFRSVYVYSHYIVLVVRPSLSKRTTFIVIPGYGRDSGVSPGDS